MFVPRHAERLLSDALSDARVVLLNGPRQSGKTTLAVNTSQRLGGTFVSLDDPQTLAAAIDDPVGFLDVPGLLVIDEIQLAGDPLVRAIKVAVDRDQRPGRFLLTGSSRFLTVPTLSESLAGRLEIVELWPFSQGELEGRRERFLDFLVGNPSRLARSRSPALTRRQYFERVCTGGFPSVQTRSDRARARWFDAYLTTLSQRDVRELADIRRAGHVPRLLRLLAARTSTELILATMAGELALDRRTIEEYLGLFDTLFVIVELPAWSAGPRQRAVRRSKLHMSDAGMCAHLSSVTSSSLMRAGSPSAGPLLETFVVGELLRQRGWCEERVDLAHLRDRNGMEVDVIVEAHDGRIAAVEVKAAASVRSEDFRWLRKLRDTIGRRFVQGVVLYCGEQRLAFGDRMAALPVSALWAA